MSTITAESKLAIGRGLRLQWEPAQNAHILLYPEGMVQLNLSAGEILRRCDGERSIEEIVADLERTFATSCLYGDVMAFVSMAVGNKWLEVRD